MTTWTLLGRKGPNNNEIYQDFLDRTGATQIDHYQIIRFGDRLDEAFLDDISIVKHIYSVGDSLSKLAFVHYGDPRFWWLLAWFNAKPTDFHCDIGDTIIIPLPLDRVLDQAYNRISL